MMRVRIALMIGATICCALALAGKSAAGTPACGIENCHGLDITCGPNVPEECTAMYALGDFCRRYVECQEIDGKCQIVASEKFEPCKTCVQKCTDQFQDDPIGVFNCEAQCRADFEAEEEAVKK